MTRIGTLAFVLSLAASAAAQDAGAPDAGVPDAEARDWRDMTVSEIEGHDPFGTDDLGLGAADPLMTLPDDDAVMTVTEPSDDDVVAPPVAVVRGAVLDAVSGVRESRHTIALTLVHGRVVVDETIELQSTARHRAEVLEHIAVPADAALVSLRVSNAAGERVGVAETGISPQGAYDDALVVRVERPSELPVAHAAIVGSELVVRAAPVVRGETLTVSFRWVAAAPMHGGALRWTMPARGRDDRLVDVELSVTSDELVEAGLDDRALDGALETRRGGVAVLVTALAPRTGGTFVEAATLSCGGERRAIARARASRPEPEPVRVVLAIDASPSTTAGARGRIADAALVLAQTLAPGSEILPVAFAARAERLADGWLAPESLDGRTLRHAVDVDLGSMTSLEALWALVRAEPTRPLHIVVVGDGGVSPTDERAAAIDEMRAAGIHLSSVNVADRSTSAALAEAVRITGGLALDVAPEARAASEDDAREALATRLRPIVSTPASSGVVVRTRGGSTELGVLPAGEEHTWSGTSTPTVVDGRREVSATELRGAEADVICAHLTRRSRLVAVEAGEVRASAGACAADGTHRARPSASSSGIFGGGLGRIALAHRRDCVLETTAPIAPPDLAGYVAPSLLRQLRRRVIPAARACFRDDRAGRLHYETRLVVNLILSDREIVHRSVEEAATPELAACIRTAVENLDLPSFDGTIVVRWPLRTEGEPVPPTAELATDLSAAIDRIGAEPTAPAVP